MTRPATSSRLDGTRSPGTHGMRRSTDSSQADASGPLSGEDLERLALAAFFVARADLERETKERAFKVYEAEGNGIRAAYIALGLARDYAFSGNHAISTVWVRRAERILGAEGDTYAHGYLALIKSLGAAIAGESMPRSSWPSVRSPSGRPPPTPT